MKIRTNSGEESDRISRARHVGRPGHHLNQLALTGAVAFRSAALSLLGTVLVVSSLQSGETTNGLAEHARDADVLVIEATFLDRDASIARDYGHLTAAEAAALAAMSNVKQLVLTHISGRYADEEILAEARKTFPNSQLAMDFDHIVV